MIFQSDLDPLTEGHINDQCPWSCRGVLVNDWSLVVSMETDNDSVLESMSHVVSQLSVYQC